MNFSWIVGLLTQFCQKLFGTNANNKWFYDTSFIAVFLCILISLILRLLSEKCSSISSSDRPSVSGRIRNITINLQIRKKIDKKVLIKSNFLSQLPNKTNAAVESSSTRQWEPHFNIVVHFRWNCSEKVPNTTYNTDEHCAELKWKYFADKHESDICNANVQRKLHD